MRVERGQELLGVVREQVVLVDDLDARVVHVHPVRDVARGHDVDLARVPRHVLLQRADRVHELADLAVARAAHGVLAAGLLAQLPVAGLAAVDPRVDDGHAAQLLEVLDLALARPLVHDGLRVEALVLLVRQLVVRVGRRRLVEQVHDEQQRAARRQQHVAEVALVAQRNAHAHARGSLHRHGLRLELCRLAREKRSAALWRALLGSKGAKSTPRTRYTELKLSVWRG